MHRSVRTLLAAAPALAATPAFAKGPPGIEPTYLIVGGASFLAGWLASCWWCRRSKNRKSQDQAAK